MAHAGKERIEERCCGMQCSAVCRRAVPVRAYPFSRAVAAFMYRLWCASFTVSSLARAGYVCSTGSADAGIFTRVTEYV